VSQKPSKIVLVGNRLFTPTFIFGGTKMAKTTELCEVHSFSTSSNLCQRTTVNADVPNCYIMLWLLVSTWCYQVVHTCIINSTEDTTWSKKTYILRWK